MIHLMHSAETLAGAVLLHNADFNDGPDPRCNTEISQRQHGETQLSYRTSRVSGIKIVNAQRAKENAKNNVGCPALVCSAGNRLGISIGRLRANSHSCSSLGRRCSGSLRQTERSTITRGLIALDRS